MLLHWATLKPLGPGKLAAVRFTAPVRIKSIRVFPTGSQPFANAEIAARTEPDTFFFNVHLNAQPTALAKDKQKASNALVLSTLAYSGGPTEFAADMGPEHSTRLLVFQGEFDYLSVAIYGDIVSEVAPPPPEYEPSSLPIVEPIQLSRMLDPANTPDPTLVAQRLLEIIPDAPPLPLVIRLVFCLKPRHEDWDDPEFPYLYAVLDESNANMDLGGYYELSKRPLPEESLDALQDLASSFAAKMSSNDQDSEWACIAAGILRNCSSQHFSIAQLLTEHLRSNTPPFLASENLNYDTLFRLLQGAANIDTAKYLGSSRLPDAIRAIASDTESDEDLHLIARRLLNRLAAWEALDDALLNTRADFTRATAAITEFGGDDCSLGIWLQNMVSHPDLLRKLAENPVLPSESAPPPLLNQLHVSVTHDEFLAFLRAYVGVACVLAVLAWSDSLPADSCLERVLAILLLWQGLDGYRDIVNHLLLVPDILDRLEYLAKGKRPTKLCLSAEKILAHLAEHPPAMVSNDFRQIILGMKCAMATVPDADQQIMEDTAQFASEGVSAMMARLADLPDRPLTTEEVRKYRVALSVITRDLQVAGRGEWQLMQTYWQTESQGFLAGLVDAITAFTEGVQSGFTIDPPPHMVQEHVGLCFLASNEGLNLAMKLLPLYPLPARSVCMLTTKIADLFVCTDAADVIYSQTSGACAAAQKTRQTCIEVTRALCMPETGTAETPTAVHVMRTLLRIALDSKADPVMHLQQVFALLDHVLPMSDTMDADDAQAMWTIAVFPRILPELQVFFSALDPDNKVHLARRLMHLDQGLIGIGEWLLTEELKQLLSTLQQLKHEENSVYREILEYRCSASLKTLRDLLSGAQSSSAWWVRTLVQHDETTSLLAQSLNILSQLHVSSLHIIGIARALEEAGTDFSPELQASVIQSLLSSIGAPFEDWEPALDLAAQMLGTAPQRSLDIIAFRESFERMLSIVVGATTTITLTDDTAIAILGVVERYATEPEGYILTGGQWDLLCQLLKPSLPADLASKLGILPAPTKLDPDYTPPPLTMPRPLTDSVEVTMGDIDDIFRAPVAPPSTPPLRAADHTPDMFAQATVSPNALLRSPSATTGLTKTYTNNSFRELRAMPAARQNTSRLPSMHVDDFQSSQSPEIMPAAGPAHSVYQQLPLAPPFSL